MLSNEFINRVRNDAIRFAVDIANDNIHGYSQTTRSLYEMDKPKSFDCSSLLCTAWQYAFEKNGITPTPKYCGCSYTGNMPNLKNCGFEVVARNQTAHASMIAGDIELNIKDHVCMAIDSNNIVHARTSEGTRDTIDNSGNEIRTQPWYLFSNGWDVRLRFTGAGIDYVNSSSKTDPVTNQPTESWKGSYYLENEMVDDWQQAMNIGFDLDGAYALEVDKQFGIASQNFAKTHILWSGQTHDCTTAIKWLQTVLHDVYGFDKIVIDGKWSDYLTLCVKEFQKNRNITVDGEVGLITTYWLLSGTVK